MTTILIGLNHRTAPLALREKLTLRGQKLELALQKLGSDGQADLRNDKRFHHRSIQEIVILSTCNRLEIYAEVSHQESACQQIKRFLNDYLDFDDSPIDDFLYYLTGVEAVRHLMQVTSGLDSMILGEPQILGQVAQAFADAQYAHQTGAILSHLFARAIHTGKRSRSDTDISRYTTSVSHAGALLVADKLADIQSANILMVGAGDMALLATRALKDLGAQNITFVNRTYSRSQAVADQVGGQSIAWHELGTKLVWADAVITATSAPHPLIFAEDLEPLMGQRNNRHLLFVDIAVPRDVEVAVGTLANVTRYDIDDLKFIVDQNIANRTAAIPQVEDIIEEEIAQYLEWYYSRQVTPVIVDLRRWANEVAQNELDQALNKLPGDDEHTRQIVNRLAHRIVNKILHEPTVCLRKQAVEGNGYGYAHAVSELFGLNVLEDQDEDEICHQEWLDNLDHSNTDLVPDHSTKNEIAEVMNDE